MVCMPRAVGGLRWAIATGLDWCRAPAVALTRGAYAGVADGRGDAGAGRGAGSSSGRWAGWSLPGPCRSELARPRRISQLRVVKGAWSPSRRARLRTFRLSIADWHG